MHPSLAQYIDPSLCVTYRDCQSMPLDLYGLQRTQMNSFYPYGYESIMSSLHTTASIFFFFFLGKWLHYVCLRSNTWVALKLLLASSLGHKTNGKRKLRERCVPLEQGGGGEEWEPPSLEILPSCSTCFEVCLDVNAHWGQQAASAKKPSVLMLNNNRRYPPSVISLWVFWMCCLTYRLLRADLSRGE